MDSLNTLDIYDISHSIRWSSIHRLVMSFILKFPFQFPTCLICMQPGCAQFLYIALDTPDAKLCLVGQYLESPAAQLTRSRTPNWIRAKIIPNGRIRRWLVSHSAAYTTTSRNIIAFANFRNITVRDIKAHLSVALRFKEKFETELVIWKW